MVDAGQAVVVDAEAAQNRKSISNVMATREAPDFGKIARTRPLEAPLGKVLMFC